MTLTPAVQRWFQLIEEYEQSSQTRAAFCADRQLNEKTFAWYRCRWLRDRAEEQPNHTPAFIELAMPQPMLPAAAMMRVQLLRQQMVLEVPVDANVTWLAQLLGALC